MNDRAGSKGIWHRRSPNVRYSNTIRNPDAGTGTFTQHLERYETVPAEMAESIVEKRRKENKVRG